MGDCPWQVHIRCATIQDHRDGEFWGGQNYFFGVTVAGRAADDGGKCYSPVKEHALSMLDGHADELAVVLLRVDAAEDYTACCGGHTVKPYAECSSGGVAVRLELIVQRWECSVWISEPGAGRVVEDGFAKAAAEADDTIESIVEEWVGHVGYCHLDAGV